MINIIDDMTNLVSKIIQSKREQQSPPKFSSFETTIVTNYLKIIKILAQMSLFCHPQNKTKTLDSWHFFQEDFIPFIKTAQNLTDLVKRQVY